MKLEIKLENTKLCNDCPCHYRAAVGKKTLVGCTIDYYINKSYKFPIESNFKVRRPKLCIKENGL